METLFDKLATGPDEFVVSDGSKGFSSFSATFNVVDE
jgi:hypothetical protein